MSTPNNSRAALISLAVLVLVWAFSWIVMKQVMAYAGPFEFSALRYIGGALILLIVLIARGGPIKPPPLGLTLAVGMCQTTGFQVFSQWALVSGGAGHVSLLVYTMPFWVVLLAWLILSERPGPRQWLGLILAAGGLICIIEPWQGFANLQATALAFLGGLSWALGTVLSKRMFIRHAPSALSFTTWQMLIGSVILGVIALLVPSRPIAWTPVFIAGLAYSIVLASSLAWLLWSFVVDNLSTSVASLSSLAVPITVVLMAWGLLAERPDRAEAIGIVLIVLGLLAVSGIGRRRRVPV